jgi:hypothetical protein
MKYVDASAVLRLVFGEPGSRVSLEPGDVVVSSHLTEVEAYRAIDRARLVGDLDDVMTATRRKALTDVLAMIDLAPIDSNVIARARGSFPIPVRSLDAIHVATAEALAAVAEAKPVEFWTHDDRQALAALSRGLTVHGVEPAR